MPNPKNCAFARAFFKVSAYFHGIHFSSVSPHLFISVCVQKCIATRLHLLLCVVLFARLMRFISLCVIVASRNTEARIKTSLCHDFDTTSTSKPKSTTSVDKNPFLMHDDVPKFSSTKTSDYFSPAITHLVEKLEEDFS
jgi:hypothetical protein